MQQENQHSPWPGAPFPPPIPFRYILYGLFFYPRLALVMTKIHGYWKSSLATALAIALVGATAKSFLTFGQAKENFRGLAELVATTLGTVTVKDNEISWEVQTGPKTANDGTWRVDVLEEGDDFPRNQIEHGACDKGIVVTKNGIDAWMRIPETGRIFPRRLLTPAIIASIFKSSSTDEPLEISQEQMKLLPNLLAPVIATGTILFHFPIYIQPVLFCSFLFIIITQLFRRDPTATFRGLLASAVCSCIPPCLLAIVFDQFTFHTVDYHTLFVILFFAYLIIILYDRSIVVRRVPPQDPEP
jgi:hypothetical protein